VNNDQPLVTTERLDAMTEAIAAAARESFAVFRRIIRPGMLWSPFVGQLTRELQKFYTAFAAGKRPKLAMMTPPQHGKSWAAEDFTAWVAGKNPDWKTIYASYSDQLGLLRNMNLQRLFRSQRYRQIFPNLTIGAPDYQCNATLIEYAGGPGSFRHTTVNGPITGMEQHLGVLDDFVKGRAEANSKLQRDKTWNWYTDDFSSRFNKDSASLVIGTRWHVDDLLGRLMKKHPEMREVSFQAIAEKDEPFRRKGEALFPSLKPLDMLLDQKKLMSEASWQAEYQQRPYEVGGGIFPIEKLQVVPAFDRGEISSTVLAVDKAATHGGDGAFTAIVIMHRMKNGTFVIERVVRGRWGVLERERNIKYWADATKETLRTWCFKVVIEVEPGSGGKESAEATIRNLAGHACIGDKPGAGRSKELRAEPFAAQVQGGNVYLHAGAWVQDFLEEAESFPNSPYKDQIDAAAMAFHHLAVVLGYPIEIYERVNR
jgi:predicted phage terminase large subunit-like protein